MKGNEAASWDESGSGAGQQSQHPKMINLRLGVSQQKKLLRHAMPCHITRRWTNKD